MPSSESGGKGKRELRARPKGAILEGKEGKFGGTALLTPSALKRPPTLTPIQTAKRKKEETIRKRGKKNADREATQKTQRRRK